MSVRLKRYEEAVKKLSETHALNASYHEALLSRGNVYVDFGNREAFELARQDYQAILRTDASNMDAQINMAYLLQMVGRFQRAWQQFSNAMRLRADYAPLYEGRAIVCLQMSDTRAALKDMNEALRLRGSGSSAELLVNRGVIHQHMADNVNAMRDYQAAILVDPNYALAYYNSANVYLMHRQYAQALHHLSHAIDVCDMRDDATLQNRAIARALTGDSAGAFADLCEAIRCNKYASHAYMNRALLLYKMGNFYLAEKDLSMAIMFAKSDAMLYKLRADCRGQLDRRDEAIADYKQAVQLNMDI